MREFLKDPDALLDYTFDWSDWLEAGETLSSAAVTVGSGLTKSSESNTATTSTVWLSGGTEGNRYVVKCHIVTSLGKQDDRSIIVRVANR